MRITCKKYSSNEIKITIVKIVLIVILLSKNFRLYSDKSTTISFESHLSGLDEQPRELLIEIRDFIRSLGDNVIEEIRPHRIVYAKSLTFRTFLDIQPRGNSLVFSIRKSRTEPASVCTIRSSEQSKDIKAQIAMAYTSIK